MSHGTCTFDNCGKAHRARGLCSTHYNQQHQPNSHRKVERSCDSCGVLTLKEPSRANRYANTYCSALCRNWGTYGVGVSSRLPINHWARWFGATCAWEPKTFTVDCEWCGDRKVSRSPVVRYCSRLHKKRHSKVIRKGRERGAIGDYTWMDITRLWVLFDGACAYCRVATPLSEIQAEHVVPLSRGGANNRTNLLPSCGACNSDKRDLPLSEWNADRKRRDLLPVLTEWSDDDVRYAHLTSTRTGVLV